jgi:hypothetical protein
MAEEVLAGVGDDEAIDKDLELGLENGVRFTKKLKDPLMPSQDEIAEHRFTHLPFRSWCRHCVMGRGKQMPHQASQGTRGIPEVHLDFCFMGEEDEPGKTVAILCARERDTRMTMATVAPSKSSTGAFIARRAAAFLREIGCEQNDIIVKSDQEPAMLALLSEIGRVRATVGNGKCIPEHSPVGSSASNGVIERGVQSVEQMIRVLKSGLQERWGLNITTFHPIIPWLVEYAAFLLNRFEVGRDGKTAYERSKGKTAKSLGLEIGEAVLWRRKPVGGAMAKLTCLWSDGVFLGIRGVSGEIIIGDKSGVWKTRSIQRKPIEERWAKSSADMIGGVPWR